MPTPNPFPPQPSDSTARERARAHAHDLATFVEASPSSFHAAHEVARRLVAAGFTRLEETAAWPGAGDDGAAGGRYVVVRDGAVIAWVVPPGATTTTPFAILGAHTDSPGFTLKPRPSVVREGWWQAGVEVYGGPLLNSWLDRELELAGRVVVGDGTGPDDVRLVRTGPLLRIPQLAIHLDRAANDGLALDKQQHTQPVWGLASASGPAGSGDVVGHDGADDGRTAGADVLAELAHHAGVRASEITGYDVVVADTQAPRVFGARDAFLASGRLDNLLSVHAGLTALLEVAASGADDARDTAPTTIPVLAAFDHEEIGSQSRSGASGPFLADVLARVAAGLGATEEERHRQLAASLCVSSDVGHSVHPNYPERHDPVNRPLAGGGPILKINANQRYSTDALGAAAWARACAAAGVPSQEFVSRNTVPCGSTIGPLTATRLGIRVVDVGVPLLSMHSARELTAVVDPWYLTRAVVEVFRG
ncbi:M18 family aminopeptidase [Cellulosimicrobium marinum]|uniref:M18 family aminopeptidase n=1 Tax=Cellulosimicrobium marinum TaxID=1638992 RepID=UPI001E5872A4|nr:M18 family aminopeptidase [Cellulosimicrobium marinum]MCB7135257.1 M18 family aminopeptidase [Cellulosimicrobium marinum]